MKLIVSQVSLALALATCLASNPAIALPLHGFNDAVEGEGELAVRTTAIKGPPSLKGPPPPTTTPTLNAEDMQTLERILQSLDTGRSGAKGKPPGPPRSGQASQQAVTTVSPNGKVKSKPNKQGAKAAGGGKSAVKANVPSAQLSRIEQKLLQHQKAVSGAGDDSPQVRSATPKNSGKRHKGEKPPGPHLQRSDKPQGGRGQKHGKVGQPKAQSAQPEAQGPAPGPEAFGAPSPQAQGMPFPGQQISSLGQGLSMPPYGQSPQGLRQGTSLASSPAYAAYSPSTMNMASGGMHNGGMYSRATSSPFNGRNSMVVQRSLDEENEDEDPLVGRDFATDDDVLGARQTMSAPTGSSGGGGKTISKLEERDAGGEQESEGIEQKQGAEVEQQPTIEQKQQEGVAQTKDSGKTPTKPGQKAQADKKDESPTLSKLLLPRRSWAELANAADYLIEERNDDDGNVFWDRELDVRSVDDSDATTDEARDLVDEAAQSLDARYKIPRDELNVAPMPSINRRSEDIEDGEKTVSRSSVEGLHSRDWRATAQKAIDCYNDPQACALNFVGLHPRSQEELFEDFQARDWRSAAKKALDCYNDPTTCAVNAIQPRSQEELFEAFHTRDWRSAAKKAIDCYNDPTTCAVNAIQPRFQDDEVFEDLHTRDWRSAAKKAIDCYNDPTTCAVNAIQPRSQELFEDLHTRDWRSAAKKAIDCYNDPTTCAVNAIQPRFQDDEVFEGDL